MTNRKKSNIGTKAIVAENLTYRYGTMTAVDHIVSDVAVLCVLIVVAAAIAGLIAARSGGEGSRVALRRQPGPVAH